MDLHKVDIKSESEYKERLEIFAKNDLKIKEHNSRNATFTLEHNQFSYYTEDEFRELMGTRPPPLEKGFKALKHTALFSKDSLPDNVDWVSKGAVTHIRNQGQCGSCWAFATAGALEGAHFIKTKTSVDLSEQELLDCDTVDAGCQGGWMDNAYQWIEDNGGLCKEDDYPYVQRQQRCKKNRCDPVASTKVVKWVDIQNDESALMDAVAQRPVAAAIEASTFGFQFYKDGVYQGECTDKVDHGVLIVGYGTQDGVDYWKVKNSWGETWGKEGYLYIQRGVPGTGKCGLASNTNYPVLA